MLPDWVSHPPAPRAPRGQRRRARYLARGLQDMARLVDEAVFCEREARRPGFLQQLDPRAKLVTTIGLAVGASFVHHIAALLVIAGFAITCMLASGVRAGAVFNRVWWAVPGLFALVSLPASLNVFVPGDPLVGPVAGLAITRQGLSSAALLAVRVATGLVVALMLALTTRWQDLLRSAYTRASAPFVLVAMMTYRYLFVLLRVAEAMHLGRQARTITPGAGKDQRAWVAGRVGALFRRSRHLAEGVYAAMVARGYRGEPKTLMRARWGLPEAGWLALCATLLGSALALDRIWLEHWSW